MMVRCRQRLQVEGHDYEAGDVVDMPYQAASVHLQFGRVERVDTGEEERLLRAQHNRIRRPGKNRGRTGAGGVGRNP
jgi:hypothetical protein